MSFCEFRWFSKVLGMQVATNVILPDNAKPPHATYYLLHGLSDDYTAWHRRTRIEVYAEKYPLIVVMPHGFRNFYTDNNEGAAYAKYIGEELPEMIERTFHAKPTRNARCIGGLSMGGYGAFRIALGYPDKFVSANSHSGAMLADSKISNPKDVAERRRIFGKHSTGTNHDLLHLARQCKKAGNLPKLLIDCGTEDFLLNDNREFHASLEKENIPHEYHEFPGIHEWEYWDEHVQEALAFHAKAMKLKI